MYLKPSKTILSKTRAAAFHSGKKKFNPSAVRPQRSCIIKKIPSHKNGYEFLHEKEPVFNFKRLSEIKDQYLSLLQIKEFKVPKSELGYYHAVFELEKIIYDFNPVDPTESYIKVRGCEGIFEHHIAPGGFQDFDNTPYIGIEYYHQETSSGCYLLSYVFEDNSVPILTGMAIMEYVLGVPTWEQMGVEEDVNEVMDHFVVCSRENVPEDDPDQLPYDADNWRNNSGEVGFYNYANSLKIQDVVDDERTWKNAHNTVTERFYKILNNLDFNKLDKWSKQKTDIGLFIRGILYLVANKFSIFDYSVDSDQDHQMVPAWRSFGFMWADDNYLAAIDATLNVRYEGGLSGLSFTDFYFPNGKITLNSPNRHMCMHVMTLLFHFNPAKKVFDYDEKSYNIQALFSSLSIDGWQTVLHRAIKNHRGRMDRGMAPYG